MALCFFLLKQKQNNASLPPELFGRWYNIQIEVICESSLLSRRGFGDLNRQLCQIRQGSEVFGGCSIIFAGNVCQFKPDILTSVQLLFVSPPLSLFEQILNVTVILGSQHRFNEEPKWEELLKHF